MSRWLLVFGVFGVWQSSVAGSYDNHTLLRLFPTNEDQLKSIHDFKDPEGQVEIFKRSRGYNDSMDVLVPPLMMHIVENYARTNNLTLEVKENNYGRKFDIPDRKPRRRVLRGNTIFAYNSYATINDVMENLAKQYPNVLSLEDLGKSYQGRRMTLAKLSSNPGAGNPIIFVDAGIHAREWVAPAMALYLINRLASDASARDELKGVDWYILPLVNPDGYEFTRSSPENRMWRKTMSHSEISPQCFGVDGNRNYGFKWAVSGVSKNPCDKETYAGARPFSEPETQIIKRALYENKDRIKLYVSLHAYGQYLVYPWGYTGDRLPKEWKKLDRMAKIVSSAVVRAGGPPFKVLSAGKWYPAAGGSDDFAFGAIGVPYSYTMELTENYEFNYPEHLLRQTLPKFYQGFRAFASEIRREFRRN